MKHLGPLLIALFYACLLYAGIAFTVFQWRNPTANKMSFWRDFGAVVRFEKLAKYQGAP